MSLAGGLEVDESYFGGGRKDKRGRGASCNVPGLGLLSAVTGLCQGLPDIKSCSLKQILEYKIAPGSIV
jgi:hypothetical protein